MSGSTLGMLNTVLADSYVLMMKTQAVHWGVTGQEFYSVHLLTETQYNELFMAVDEIAEHILSVGGKPASTLAEFVSMANLKEGVSGTSVESLVKELMTANEEMARILNGYVKDGLDVSTEDLIVSRIRVHEKAAWMWRSTYGVGSGASTGSSVVAAKKTRAVASTPTPVAEKPKAKSSKKSKKKSKSKSKPKVATTASKTSTPAKKAPSPTPRAKKVTPAKKATPVKKTVAAKPAPKAKATPAKPVAKPVVKKAAPVKRTGGRLSRNISGTG